MVYSISRSLPGPAPPAPPPHYQSFLTPLLHRRFANACIVSFVFCYVQAFLISDKSSFFWAVFPISWTGFKCLVLFFFSALPVLMLRIAQLHVVKRANPSPFHTFQKCIGSFSTYTTIFTYLLSSGVFTVLYLLSSTYEDQLGIVVEGRSYERPRLNERFLYLLFFATYTGILQGIYHVYMDRSRLDFPDVPVSSYKDVGKNQLSPISWNAGIITMVAVVTAPVAYLPFRPIMWSYTLWFARRFYWLNRSAMLPGFPVTAGMAFRTAFIAFATCLSAEIAHVAFRSFFVEDPFQSGKTVTDKSRDPNGTLLTGLRTTKMPLTQSIAFWELSHLSKNRADRRKSIFADVDRKPVNMWEQILQECLRCVNEVEIKINELMTPHAPAPPVTSPAVKSPSTSSLRDPPAIPVRQNNILVTTSRSPGRNLVDMVQSVDGATPSAALRKRLPIPDSFSASQSQTSVVSTMKDQMAPLLASPYGKPFRQTIQLMTTAAIPNVRIPIDAVSALGRLVVASLKEDDYGVVQGHVGKILQSFCATLETLEKYVANPPLHWTDTEARNSPEPLWLPEPQMLIAQLKATINEITVAFSPYLKDILSEDVRNRLPVTQ